MEAITTRGRTLEIPSHIEELSPQQYVYYCFLSFALSGGLITVERFRIRWLSYLIGLGKKDYTVLKDEYIAELDQQIKVIDGFFRPSVISGREQMHLDFDTPNNLLPKYKGYVGPGNWLEGISFGDFVKCLTIFESLNNAPAEAVEDGYKTIARVLYKIPEADSVPELLVFHAPRLFLSVWNAIQSGPIDINGKNIDFRIIFRNSGNSRADDKTGWTGITFEIATAGLFGTVKEVEAADFWEVLIYLYKCKFEYNHEKNKLKK